MKFLNPHAAYLFLGVFLFLALGISLFYHRNKIPFHFKKVGRAYFWSKLLAFCLGWIFAILALMQPVGNVHYITQENAVKTQNILFLVDASASMLVTDMRNGESRFAYAKEIVDHIISKLKGEYISLNAFTVENVQLSPLTLDYLFVRMMLQEMHINEGDKAGTNLPQAIKEAYKENSTLIILSDGGTEDSSFLPEKNSFIISIGMGSKEGGIIPGVTDEGKPVRATLDDVLLKKISNQYYEANQSSISELSQKIIRNLKGSVEKKETTEWVYESLFQIPLAFALLFFGFVIFYPDTTRKLALLLFIPLNLYGSLPREAEVYFEAKEYAKALEIYNQMEALDLKDWQKVALQHNKKVIQNLLEKNLQEESIPDFSIPPESDPRTVLMKLIEIQEYVLKKDPDLQEKVLALSAAFIPSVQKKQKKDYPLRCQCYPWKEALPLFFEGKNQLPKNGGKTLKLWREALIKMEESPKEDEAIEEELLEKESIPYERQIIREEGIKPW